MTEKDYSGATTSKIGKNAKALAGSSKEKINFAAKETKFKKETTDSDILDLKSYEKAGAISKQVKEYAKSIVRKDMLLSELADKIESKIIELDGELAFPVNLSIDDVAAHYTPTSRDDKKASGLLKIDLGVHINGCISDIAFTIDLTPEKKYSKLGESSEKALKSAVETIKKNKEKTTLSQIGKAIQQSIEKDGFYPIINLSGHSLGEFDIHSGLTISNIDNGSNEELGEGAFAIEPFATLNTGSGSIYEGAGSNIYHLTGTGVVRDTFSREVLTWILETKKTLPFSQRELEKKFGTRILIALNNLKKAGAIREFEQLVEKNHAPVSQAETSIVISQGKVIVLVE